MKKKEFTILIVDDNTATVRILSYILKREGYKVLEAMTGTDSLRLVKERNPDLIMLDVFLPDMNGVEICRQIKNNPDLKHVLVVLISGIEIESKSQVHGLDAGAEGYLVKPVSKQVLLAYVRLMERIKRNEDELRDAAKILDKRVKQRTKKLETVNKKLLNEISERKEIEKILESKEEHYRMLFLNNPIPLWVYDRDTLAFLAVNDAAVQQYGYSAEEFLSMTLKAIHTEEEETRFLQSDDAGGETLRRAGSFRHRKKDGTIIDVEITTHDLIFEEKPARLVMANDITMRKRAEEAVRDSEERFRMIFENVFDGISIHSNEPDAFQRKLIECNEHYASMAGRSREELLQCESTQGLQIPFEERANSNRMESIAKGESFRGSFSWIRPDGKDNIVEYTGVPIIWRGKSYTIGIDRDITEQKRAELEILKLNRTYAVLSNINQLIVRERDRQKIFEGVCRIVIEDGKMLMCWIGLVDAAAGKVKPVAHAGIINGYFEQLHINLDGSAGENEPTTVAIRDARNIICNNIEHDGRMYPWKEKASAPGFQSSASFPLRLKTKIIGTINYYSSEKNFFNSQEIALFNELAMDLSYALEMIDTEEKRDLAVEALAESERRQRGILDSIPDPAWLKSKDGTYLAVNKAWCKYLNKEEKEVLGKNEVEEMFSDSAKRIFDEDWVVFNTGVAHQQENEFSDLPGDTRWFETIKNPLLNKDGSIVGITGIARDITARKQMENALRKSENEYRLLFQHNPHPMCIYNPENLFILDINDAFIPQYGYTREELLKMTIKDIRPPEDIPLLLEDIENLSSGLSKTKIWRHRRKNGTIIYVEITAHTSPFEGKQARIVLAHDVTDRMQMETALKESEDRYRLLLEYSPIGIAVHSEGKIVFSNLEGANILGAKAPEEIIGKSIREIVHPQSWDETYHRIQRLLNGEKGLYPLEEIFIRLDGTPIHVEVMAVPITYFGKPSMQVIVTDITARKKLEEQTRKLTRAVEQSPSSIIITNVHGDIEYVNPKFEKLTQYRASEVIGKNPRVLKSGETTSETYAAMWQAVTTGKEWNGEFHNRKKNGELYWEAASISPIVDENGVITHFLAEKEDVTERKRAEEDLRRATEGTHAIFWHALVNKAEDETKGACGFYWDTHYANLDVVQKFLDFPDYPTHDLSDRFFFSWLEEDRKVMAPQSAAALREGMDGYTQEFRLQDAKGNIHWMYTDAHIRRLSEKTFEVAGIIVDISDRKRTEETLRQSEERFRKLIESAPAAVVILSNTGKILYANPTSLTIFGVSNADDVQEKLILDYLAPDVHGDFFKHYHLRSEGVPVPNQFETIGLRGDGTRFPVHIAVSHLQLQDEDVTLNFITDITRRKQAEEIVNLLSHTVKSIGEFVCVTDMNGKIVFVNQAFLDGYGYSQNEVIGKTLEAISASSGKGDRNLMRAAREGGWQGELMSRRKDGYEFPISLSTSLVLDDKGKAIAHVMVAADITERKRLQHELLQSQKMQSIGTLAGGIAHDFNNILGIILGYISLLEKRLAYNPEYSMSINAMQRAVERGAALVRQILTFARKTDVIFEAVDVGTLMEEMIPMLQQTFPKTITFSKNIQNGLPGIYADRSQIHQVLLNLCVNARDAMPNGGTVMLTAEKCMKAQIQDRFPEANQRAYVCLSVADTGEGMNKATSARAFEPFFTTKPQGKGTGLGLSVVYGVVEAHDGFIDLESEESQGTTFRLYFPVSSIEENQDEPFPSEKFAEFRGSETILLVEDEEFLLEMACISLESSGYKVYRAEDGIEAVEVYIAHKDEINLVITDMGLPGMTGAEEYGKLKELNPQIKVILSSGFLDPEVKAGLLEAGALGFLQKPFKPQEILKMVRDVLDKKT
jgi:PAS domain S-box-containing protein